MINKLHKIHRNFSDAIKREAHEEKLNVVVDWWENSFLYWPVTIAAF